MKNSFEEWWELHQPSYPGRDQARAFARWAWGDATIAERERCLEAIGKALDALGTFEDVETDIGSWDVRRYCIAAISGKKMPEPEPCDAVIYHGPGHQSKTKCYRTGIHFVHETRYGSFDQLARWTGDKVFSGFFDEPPEEEELGEGTSR